MNMAERSLNGRKQWEKKELPIIGKFSFPPSVFMRLVLQTHKNQGLFEKQLIKLFLKCKYISDPKYLTTLSRSSVKKIPLVLKIDSSLSMTILTLAPFL